jgi:predicted ABC-type ATPase
MNLQAAVALRKPLPRPSIKRVWASGTSEGAVKGWDTRGRGRKEESRKFTLPNGREIDVSHDPATQDAQLEKIRQEELAKLPENVREAFAKGVDTKGVFQKDGSYAPERQAMHDQIITSYLEGHQPQAEPRLEIVAGGTASGKSMASAEIKNQMSDYVYANTDNIRAMLPEIGAFVGNDKQGLLHEEASDIRDRMLDLATKAGYNVVLDAPGSHGVINFANTAEGRGYTVGVSYVHRDVESSQDGAVDRKYNATDLSDLRDVPRSVTFGSHLKARGALQGLAAVANELKVYNNQGERGLVYWRDADGKVRVYNGDKLGVIAHGQNSSLPEIPDSTFSH